MVRKLFSLLFPLVASIALMGGVASAGEAGLRRAIVDEARLAGLPAPLALALAKVGSGFRFDFRDSQGHVGPMALDVATVAVATGATPSALEDPLRNIEAGIAWLGRLHLRTGGWERAVRAYRGAAVDADKFVTDVMEWAEIYSRQQALWCCGSDRASRPNMVARAAPWPEPRQLDLIRGERDSLSGLQRRLESARRELDSWLYDSPAPGQQSFR